MEPGTCLPENNDVEATKSELDSVWREHWRTSYQSYFDNGGRTSYQVYLDNGGGTSYQSYS